MSRIGEVGRQDRMRETWVQPGKQLKEEERGEGWSSVPLTVFYWDWNPFCSCLTFYPRYQLFLLFLPSTFPSVLPLICNIPHSYPPQLQPFYSSPVLILEKQYLWDLIVRCFLKLINNTLRFSSLIHVSWTIVHISVACSPAVVWMLAGFKGGRGGSYIFSYSDSLCKWYTLLSVSQLIYCIWNQLTLSTLYNFSGLQNQ